MNHYIRYQVIPSAMAIALSLFLSACGGKETVATRSAEAFREAQQKGTPMGGDSHGGHSAGGAATDSAAGSGGMAGMDHSKMDMKGQTGMVGMDHSKMNMSGKPAMAGMDHSKMNMGGQQPMAGMDHSKMNMSGQQPMAGMDHSKMNMSGQPAMAGMDHSNMPGMQQGAAVEVMPPTTNQEMQQIRPAATLRVDSFDAPVPVSVSEAMKSTTGVGTMSDETRDTAPGQDEQSSPAPAMDHSQHGQAAPAAAQRATPRASKKTQPRPAAAALYSCPMHPEVTSNKPGTCPKCGMALVRKK